MKFKEYLIIQEAVYDGNIGIMEMVKFYQTASNEQKNKMKEYVEKKMFDMAWKLLSAVTGINLKEPK